MSGECKGPHDVRANLWARLGVMGEHYDDVRANLMMKKYKNRIVLPPYSNTGVVNTKIGVFNMFNYEIKRKNGLVAVIDWLSFTDVLNTDVEASLLELGFSREEFADTGKGAFGYKKMLLHKGTTIRVLYDGNEDMGIHYDISGSSISEFFNHYRADFLNDSSLEPGIDLDMKVLRDLLVHISEIGHVTRLDLAIDDKFEPFYTLPELQTVLEEQRFVSKFRSWRLVKDSTTSGDLTGATLYLGSRQSDIMLRIYDKQLEQIAKGVEGAANVPWVRWEFELKNEYANIALTDILNGIDVGSLCFGILSNYLRIIVVDDSNKSRCSTDEVWSSFLGEVKNIHLFVMQAPPTLLDKKDWVLKQVAPTITGLILANYGDISWLMQHMEQHAKRMNKHLKELVSKENPEWRDMLLEFD